MFPKKIGGGNEPEFYDPETGEYSDEEKAKLLDNELANIVMRYIFNLNDTFDPQFPIFGFHTEEYCELYVKFRITKNYKDLDYNKIDNYLLKPLKKDDKSNFFTIHGYDKSKRDELYNQIISNTDMLKKKFDHLNAYGIVIKAPTKIYSYKNKEYILITTVWIYKNDGWFHFVTVDLKNKGEK